MKGDQGAVHILLYFREVTGSNPESETGYHHWDFWKFSSVISHWSTLP